MFSLRGFHLFFILLAILGADLFGIWAIVQYIQGGSPGLLLAGVGVPLGGLGLLFYGIWFVRKTDQAHIV